MTSFNTICQNMKLKLAKNDQKFCQFLELLGDRLEVCVSVVHIEDRSSLSNIYRQYIIKLIFIFE